MRALLNAFNKTVNKRIKLYYILLLYTISKILTTVVLNTIQITLI